MFKIIVALVLAYASSAFAAGGNDQYPTISLCKAEYQNCLQLVNDHVVTRDQCASVMSSCTADASGTKQPVTKIGVGACVYPIRNPKTIKVYETSIATESKNNVVGFKPYTVQMVQDGLVAIWSVEDNVFTGWVNQSTMELQDPRNCN